jgi:putative membrane protein
MKNYLFPVLFAASVSLLSGCGGSSDATSVNAAGKHNEELLESTGKDEKGGWFVAEVASGGMFEVELGRLASSKATDPRVRQLGELMMNHHTQTNTQLKQIADLKNLIVPTSLSDNHQKTYNAVMSTSGAAFDKAYLEAMEEDHKETIEKFEEMSEEGTDLELKAFASKNLPTLHAHLSQVEKLKDEIQPQ